MKKLSFALLIVCILFGFTAAHGSAQIPQELELALSRDWGYGGFGNDIQGLFTMKIKNPPDNLTRVSFFIDDISIGEDNQPPFSVQFNTDSYSIGSHTLSAVGYTTDGAELNSTELQAQFVPAGTATKMIGKVVVPIIGLVLIIIVIAFVLPTILNKGKVNSLALRAPRNYGIGGGAICPKCGRPFPLRLWFINIGFNKIDRCPYCGKWSFVRPRSIAELRQAETAELAMEQTGDVITGVSDADKLKKELDDSKYQDV